MITLPLLALLPGASLAQPATEQVQQFEAVRVTDGAIEIDGDLSESVWQGPGLTDLVQTEPDEGQPSRFKTEVWIAYDDKALYVAARLHDPAPDSIVSRLARKDDDLNSDVFEISLDPFHDHQTGFRFYVNPCGCVCDEKLYNDGWDDSSWDAVWEAQAKTGNGGWTAEMRIPFTQLRFHNNDGMVWGFNCRRLVARCNEISSVVRLPKGESGYVSKFAHLVGLSGIEAPARMEFLPYVVGKSEFFEAAEGDPFTDGSELSGAAGLDFKVGIASNLTMDGAVNPDFGQVEVDPAVVNLSQFETFFEEKRPFFIEGSDIFSFGYGGATSNWDIQWPGASFFYSRRIGRAPRGSERHEGFSDRPDASTILGAAKVTGKLPGDWSLGVLQAVTGREYAEIDSSGVRFKDEIEPLTSYTIMRTQKRMSDGKYAIGLLGTGTVRDINTPAFADELAKQAFTLGLDGWAFLDKGKTWVVNGWTGGTYVNGTDDAILSLQKDPRHYFQRPDAPHVEIDEDATSLGGWAGRVSLNKEKGNVITNVALGAISPGFEANNMGFQYRGDLSLGHVVGGYQWFKPDRLFREKGGAVAVVRGFDFGGRRINDAYFLFTWSQFANYWNLDLNCAWMNSTIDNNLTRGGPAVRRVPLWWTEVHLHSDSRKKLEMCLSSEADGNEVGGRELLARVNLIYKPVSQVRVTLTPEYYTSRTVAQWVGAFEDVLAAETYGSRYVFGTMDYESFSLGLRLNSTFTPKTSLQLYARPLVSTGDYYKFKELSRPCTFDFDVFGSDGSTIEESDGYYVADPDGAGPSPEIWIADPDFNYKSLKVNTVFRWEYRPGSALYLVWTQLRENEFGPGKFDLSRDFKELFNSKPENAFLVKVTYWLSL
ncbi:MAG: DUF5916 domain-containing protein [Candidatus Eisenbacteria bacterium]